MLAEVGLALSVLMDQKENGIPRGLVKVEVDAAALGTGRLEELQAAG